MIIRAITSLVGKRVLIGAAITAFVVVAGWFGYNYWKRVNLEVRLNEATVEVIRQDALIEKQNDYAYRLQDDGERANYAANERALLVLRPETRDEPDVGAEALNEWLEGYKDD